MHRDVTYNSKHSHGFTWSMLTRKISFTALPVEPIRNSMNSGRLDYASKNLITQRESSVVGTPVSNQPDLQPVEILLTIATPPTKSCQPSD